MSPVSILPIYEHILHIEHTYVHVYNKYKYIQTYIYMYELYLLSPLTEGFVWLSFLCLTHVPNNRHLNA